MPEPIDLNDWATRPIEAFTTAIKSLGEAAQNAASAFRFMSYYPVYAPGKSPKDKYLARYTRRGLKMKGGKK